MCLFPQKSYYCLNGAYYKYCGIIFIYIYIVYIVNRCSSSLSLLYAGEAFMAKEISSSSFIYGGLGGCCFRGYVILSHSRLVWSLPFCTYLKSSERLCVATPFNWKATELLQSKVLMTYSAKNIFIEFSMALCFDNF